MLMAPLQSSREVEGRMGIIEPCFVDGMSVLMMDYRWNLVA